MSAIATSLVVILIVLQLIGLFVNLLLISYRKQKLDMINTWYKKCQEHYVKCSDRGCTANTIGRMESSFDDELKEIRKKENQEPKD